MSVCTLMRRELKAGRMFEQGENSGGGAAHTYERSELVKRGQPLGPRWGGGMVDAGDLKSSEAFKILM